MSTWGWTGATRRRATPEDSVALRTAVLVAVLAATSAVVRQGVGGPLVAVGATAGIAAAFVYSHRTRHGDSWLLKAGLAAGVVAAFATFLAGLPALHAGALAAVQVPLAELFLWVQLLHALDVPARRDLMFSLLSSLVLMGVAGVLSRSSGLGVHLLVWAPAAVTALALAHRRELEELPGLPSRPGHPARSGGAPVSGQPRRWAAARPIAATVAAAVLAGAALLAVAPAAGPGRAVSFPAALRQRIPVAQPGGLANPSLGAADPAGDATGSEGASSFGFFGFASQLDIGHRGRPDQTVVLRVKAARPDFWRGQTFDVWDGRVWRQSDQRTVPVQGDSPLELHLSDEDASLGAAGSGEELVQTFYIERPGPNVVLAANTAERLWIADRTVFQLSDGSVRTAVHLAEGAVYTVVSRRPAVTASVLRAAPSASTGPAARRLATRYTQLPAVPERVRALAGELTAGLTNTYDKVRAIERWMGQNTAYTLDIPPLPPGADAVEQFLFVDRRGFCEQIASALVVMLRSVGIPARLAVGYAAGQRNPFTGLFEVRASDAHAWAEVWFPGIGWQPFDPTASVPLSGERWSNRAVAGLIAWVTARLPDRGTLATAAAVTALGAGAVAASTAAGRRRRRRRAEAARSWPDRMLDRLEAVGEDAGRPRRPFESAALYARAVAHATGDDRLSSAGAILEADAYGPGEVPEADRLVAERVLAEASRRRTG